MNLLLTGASGFIGRGITRDQLRRGTSSLRCAVRRQIAGLPEAAEQVIVSGLGDRTDWTAALRCRDAVVHTAARVHVMRENSSDPLAEFRRVNVAGTLNLARQAAGAGVRRFVFISSVKVNGERTAPGRPYLADDDPAPADPYGVSKYEAEQGLRQLAVETGLEVVIIRPVLVYGPGVKGNFRSMLRLLCRRIPLPLGAIHNRRSLVALDNLVDLIEACLRHPHAENQTFLAADGEDLSTTQLLRRAGEALGRPARLVPVPALLLQAAAQLSGKTDLALRLLGSLQADIGKAKRVLGWSPPVSVDDALKSTAGHFLQVLHHDHSA